MANTLLIALTPILATNFHALGPTQNQIMCLLVWLYYLKEYTPDTDDPLPPHTQDKMM